MHDGDKKWIAETIRIYDSQHQSGEDSIALCVLSARREQAELTLEGAISRKTGVVGNSQSGRRHSVAIPEKLYYILRRKYPTLFTTDINWFKRHFPMFIVGQGR